MSVDDFDESRRIAPVWRRIMILLAVIAAVPVVLWSITAFVRAYVAPPAVPTFRPITATASVPTTRAPEAVIPAAAPATAPARALAAIVRSTAIEDNKLPAPPPPIVEAKATTSDARGIPPVVDGGKSPASAEPSAPAEANAAPPPAIAPSPSAAMPAAAAMPPPEPPPAPAQVADDTPPAGEPLAGPVPLPPHRPLVTMAQGGIPVPRPRPAVPGDTTVLAPADINLSAHDYMR